MAVIKFLGTCGGRFATIYQTRSTGGIYLKSGKMNIAIDPGPGALVRMHKELIDPTRLDMVIVSHCHIDHSNDATILVEAMTKGSTRRNGILIGSSSVTKGFKGAGPVIPGYQMSKLETIITARPGQSFSFGELEITATPSEHTDKTTVGFIFKTGHGDIGYISDSAFFEEMKIIYEGCRMLIISTTRPLNARIHHHFSTEDAAELIGRVKPEMAILTHFGLKTLRQDPRKEAEWVEERTGIKTVAAFDSMVVEMLKKINIIKKAAT